MIELERQLGLDVMVRMWINVNGPLYLHMGGLDVSQETENWEVSTTRSTNGDTQIISSVIRTPGGRLEQDISVNEIRPGTFMYACTRKPIRTRSDLDLAIRYEPSMPSHWPALVQDRVRPVKVALGDSGILAAWAPNGPFNVASLLIDLDKLYALFLTDFSFYADLMLFAMRRSLPYVEAIRSAGVDVMIVGGNVAGDFVGRRSFDRYILPFETDYMREVQRDGTPALYHNCGRIMGLLESYKALGVRMVESFSPPPMLGNCDLSRAIELVDDAYVMMGGLDQINVLQHGTCAEVERATRTWVQTGKRAKRFIAQPADFIEYGTPIENVETYARVALEEASL